MPELCQELAKLEERFRRVLQDAPEMQRALHERMGDTLLEEVRIRTPVSERGHKLKNGYHAPGTVRTWQRKKVGEGGGYAAIRPYPKPPGRDGPAAITTYLENGHAIRRPAVRTKKGSPYTPRIRKAGVPGKHFYQEVRTAGEALLTPFAEQFANELAKEMNKPL